MVAPPFAFWKSAAHAVSAAPCADEPIPFSVPESPSDFPPVVPSFDAQDDSRIAAATATTAMLPVRVKFTVFQSGVCDFRMWVGATHPRNYVPGLTANAPQGEREVNEHLTVHAAVGL